MKRKNTKFLVFFVTISLYLEVSVVKSEDEECTGVDDGERVDCGADEADCIAKNCCWKEGEEGSSTPWCYYKPSSPCSSNPCVNGKCMNNSNGGYRCDCYLGYIGENCEDLDKSICATDDPEQCTEEENLDVCNELGCCYDVAINVCYFWAGGPRGPPEENCVVDVTERVDCGVGNIRLEECVDEGCCWEPVSTDDVPWCFVSYGRLSTKSITTETSVADTSTLLEGHTTSPLQTTKASTLAEDTTTEYVNTSNITNSATSSSIMETATEIMTSAHESQSTTDDITASETAIVTKITTVSQSTTETSSSETEAEPTSDLVTTPPMHTTTRQTETSSNTGVIVVVVTGSALLIVFGILIFIWFRKDKNKKQPAPTDKEIVNLEDIYAKPTKETKMEQGEAKHLGSKQQKENLLNHGELIENTYYESGSASIVSPSGAVSKQIQSQEGIHENSGFNHDDKSSQDSSPHEEHNEDSMDYNTSENFIENNYYETGDATGGQPNPLLNPAATPMSVCTSNDEYEAVEVKTKEESKLSNDLENGKDSNFKEGTTNLNTQQEEDNYYSMTAFEKNVQDAAADKESDYYSPTAFDVEQIKVNGKDNASNYDNNTPHKQDENDDTYAYTYQHFALEGRQRSPSKKS